MQLTCPCCHARYPLDAALSDDAARGVITRVGQFGGDLPQLVVVYLGLFRARGRVLAWTRAARLLEELASAIAAGVIRRHGRAWAVTRDQWIDALRIVIARRDDGKIELPLRNHAYLYEVTVGVSDKAAAAAERAAEEARRHPQAGAPAAGGSNINVIDYEALLDRARALGVDIGSDGLVRSARGLVQAIKEAQRD